MGKETNFKINLDLMIKNNLKQYVDRFIERKISISSVIYSSTSGAFEPPAKCAVIEIGGKQKIVEEGRCYTSNHLQAEVGSKLQFGRVLATINEGKVKIGTPWMKNVLVEAKLLDEFEGDKVIVFKMKPKKHSRSKNEYRQQISRFLVTNIKIQETT